MANPSSLMGRRSPHHKASAAADARKILGLVNNVVSDVEQRMGRSMKQEHDFAQRGPSA